MLYANNMLEGLWSQQSNWVEMLRAGQGLMESDSNLMHKV